MVQRRVLRPQWNVDVKLVDFHRYRRLHFQVDPDHPVVFDGCGTANPDGTAMHKTIYAGGRTGIGRHDGIRSFIDRVPTGGTAVHGQGNFDWTRKQLAPLAFDLSGKG